MVRSKTVSSFIGVTLPKQFGVWRTLALALAMLLGLAGPAPGVKAQAPAEIRDGGVKGEAPFLTLEADRSRVYQGEGVRVWVSLHFREPSPRDVRYPVLTFREMGMDPFEEPLEKVEWVAGARWGVFEFATTVYPRHPGKSVLGPAELSAAFSPGPGQSGADPAETFFGGREAVPFRLRSGTLSLDILPLPEKGRPPGFSGAVGRFDLTLEADRTEVMRGAPVTLKIGVRGRADFAAVSPPGLDGAEGFKLYGPKVSMGRDGMLVEQAMVPRKTGLQVTPRVVFSWFDPEKAVYRTLVKGPFPLQVREERRTPPATQPGGEIPKEEIGPNKSSAEGWRPRGLFLHRNPVFFLVQALGLAGLIGAFIVQRRRERLRKAPDYAGWKRAVRRAAEGREQAERLAQQGNPGPFYDALWNTLTDLVRLRYGAPVGASGEEMGEEVLRQEGENSPWGLSVADLLWECDRSRFGPSLSGCAEMDRACQRLKAVAAGLKERKP
jgi:hypothetical protein